MAIRRGDKIFPHFWYVTEAEEATRFYASIFRTPGWSAWFRSPWIPPAAPRAR